MTDELHLHDLGQSEPVSCDTCEACCCRLEVILDDELDIPPAFVAEDAWGGLVMHRLEDGWCAALDRRTLRCSIYSRRPQNCRDFEVGSYECLEERAHLDGPGRVRA